MKRPLIGLSTYRERGQTGVWDTQFDMLPADYARAVQATGGIPVLLPPVAPYDQVATDVVSRLDGLIITGGADVNPAAYRQAAHARTGAPRLDRDSWEFALLDAAAARALPTLGICRGMQVMAVHAGGTLIQHVPDVVSSVQHDPGGDAYGRTSVRVEPGSQLATLLGGREINVPCHHHQAVADHPGFVATAHAADGLLEAIEDPSVRFRLAVQWHPEVDPEIGVVAGLVAAALLPTETLGGLP